MKKDNQKNTDLKNSGDSNTRAGREENLSKARRKIIVGGGIIGAAGGAPEKWTSSLVESVVLPAHAATTDSGSSPDTGPAPTPTPSTPAPSTQAPSTQAPSTPTPTAPPFAQTFSPSTPAPG